MAEKIEVRIIDKAHSADINIPNQPFELFGRMIPSYVNEQWSYTTKFFPEVSTMCFPDENYDFDELSKNSVFIGAYDDERCIGLVIMQQAWFRYMYLYDLKVDTAYRGKSVGTMLLEKAKEVAKDKGYQGIYTVGQDNNLAACKFYIKSVFAIGRLDTQVYQGTKQEGKKDILFYLDI